ncbi:MAG TPA: hypothetical protein VIF62_26805, partial [Labilithrix sp.]
MTAEIRPFPFGSFEALSRADADATARLHRIARTYVRTEKIADAIAALVDDPVRIVLKRARRTDPARGDDDAVGVVLAPAGERGARVLVELDGVLAATLAARAMKQKAPRITDAARTASPAIAGAAAAVLAAALRRAHADDSVRVVSAGPAAALARDLLAAEPHATTAWLTVVVGADAFSARVTVPDSAESRAAPAALTEDALLAMGDLPIALPLVGAFAVASHADVAALAAGDAFVPASFLSAEADGALAGRVALVAPSSEAAIGADLAPDGRLVVRGSETHSWDAPMSNDSSRTVQALEDAPVVVRVELGVVEMKAREWA